MGGSNRRSRSRIMRTPRKRSRSRNLSHTRTHSSASHSTSGSMSSYESRRRKRYDKKKRLQSRSVHRRCDRRERHRYRHSNEQNNKKRSRGRKRTRGRSSSVQTPPIPSSVKSSADIPMTTNAITISSIGPPNAPTGHPWFSNVMANSNVIPEFDPSNDNQSVEWWVHKVSECAQIYAWDDRQICHYALPKLTGLAKKWYQGLPSLLYTWPQWVEKLKAAFPSTENYGDLLCRMLKIRCKFGQPLDSYYYDKIALLNRCEITGRKAVGCLIHGIDDKFVRMGASACMFEEPEKMLPYLRTVTQNEVQQHRTKLSVTVQPPRTNNRALNSFEQNKSSDAIRCFNCNETGHISVKCTKPIKKCGFCHLLGHLTKDCRRKPVSTMLSTFNIEGRPDEPANLETLNNNKVLCIATTNDNPNSKYYKIVKVLMVLTRRHMLT